MSTRKEYILCAAVVGLLLLFCVSASAGPLGIFGRNKATKTVTNTNDSTCVYDDSGECVTHTETGTGTFTAAAADPEMAAYLKRTFDLGPAAAEPAAVEATAELSAAVETNAVEDAQREVEAAEVVLANARVAVQKAIIARRIANEKLRADLQTQIDNLDAQLEALLPAEE